MAGTPIKISYTDAASDLVLEVAPSQIIPKKGYVAATTYTDTLGITHISKYLRLRRGVQLKWDWIPKSEVDRIEQYIDHAILFDKVIDFKITVDFPGEGIREFSMYRADENEFDCLYGRDWSVKLWKYSISFIERTGTPVRNTV